MLRCAFECDALYFGSPAADGSQTLLFEPDPILENSAEVALLLGLARAVLSPTGSPSTDRVAPDCAQTAERLRAAFVEWRSCAEHRRHPGITVLGAAAALSSDGPWQSASIPASKGSSPVARCLPFAFLPAETWEGAVQAQAAMTHGHPTVIASAHIMAAALRWTLEGGQRSGLTSHLHATVQRERDVYRADWLGDIWARGRADSREAWLHKGWNAVGNQLIALADELGMLLGSGHVSKASPHYLTADVALMQALRWWLSGPAKSQKDARELARTRQYGSTVPLLCGALVGASGAGGVGLREVRFDASNALLRLCEDEAPT